MDSVCVRTFKWIVKVPARKAKVADAHCGAILKRFSEMGECPEGWPDDWKGVGTPRVRRASTVYRLNSASSGKAICIKIVNGNPNGLEDAGSLYAALRHYHARSDRANGFTVPEPYGWVPEHRAVIMEWVEGRTFSAIFKREFFLTSKRHESIRKVAGWLRWFHLQSGVERGNLANRWKLAGIVKVFDKTSSPHKWVSVHDSAIRGYFEVAERSAGVLRGVGTDCAVLHGDFKPTNLLISTSGEVVGIDFFAGKRGAVGHDICRFLMDLDFYRNLLGRSLALKCPSARPNDFEVFLSAYEAQAGNFPRPVLVYQYFQTILSSLVHQRSKFNGSLRQIVRFAVFRSIARQLATALCTESDPGTARPRRMPWSAKAWIPLELGLASWPGELIWSFL